MDQVDGSRRMLAPILPGLGTLNRRDKYESDYRRILSRALRGRIMERQAEERPRATWEPHEKHGHLTTQSDLPDSVYAFPEQRKEPLTDASHVRNALARFDQVTDVSDADRALAFANIQKAAMYYGVDVSETSWRDLYRRP